MALKPSVFEGIHSAVNGSDVVGKRMVVHGKGHDEVVSYWIRIGDTFSASPWRIRWQIMQEGLQGRMTDGILVRLSQRVTPGADPAKIHVMLEDFAKQLVNSTPEATRSYLVR
jgi:EpsI family protein